MLKLIGSILIVGSCSALGLSAKQKLYDRITAIDGFLKAFDLIESELSYHLTPLPQILCLLKEASDQRLAKIFAAMENLINQNDGLSFTYKWCKSIRDHAESCALGQEEVDILCDAGSFLGRYDSAQQIRCIEAVRKRLEYVREEAYMEKQNKGNMYRTCGLALGLLTVLVLI